MKEEGYSNGIAVTLDDCYHAFLKFQFENNCHEASMVAHELARLA
jgi:hypothetical protein